ncbi:M14-type cytosolic carboxypeptidase [uncultured Algimonas sp.]|uniref:M14 family metallopeptidase n=1 Tax=uncultured Algimonas sp. TaxID=1547920 RepID=UPI002610E5BA|nr:M14-type cytosolic carboxypeptidase [uncultured Algimonas sp.]
MTISINDAFDSGNIEVIDASDPQDIRLNIRTDNNSDFYQWFHFRVAGAKGVPLRLVIENAGTAAYPDGWTDYHACMSEDRDDWVRVPTRYEKGRLVIEHTPGLDSVHYAYFAPYTMERHRDLIADALSHDGVSLDVLGQTLDGRDMDCLTIGEGDKTIWVIARQHPGESMAEWWMEGFLARLTDPEDKVAQDIRRKARFRIVPNMNPDGSFRGHLRTNAVGSNLNREWDTPTADKSPEVLVVRNAMDADRPGLCLDVHGDEALPYNFIAGAEGIPGYTDKQAADLKAFLDAYLEASADFQTKVGYPLTAPGKANLSICTNALAARFDCLAMTLEMPFKDNANAPDRMRGWDGNRSAQLGSDTLDAMAAVIDRL